jgi:ubiquinone/menaquinone biosynthesis C-methylase UbiE
MITARETQEYYDDFSSSYERGRDRGYHQLIDDLEIGVTAPLAEGKRVLEAGCGTGLILHRLAGCAAEAWGFDLSPGMVSAARDRGLNVVLGNVTAIPFRDDAFDLVCCFKVLAHVPDIDAALRELARVTRPGGVLALEFYNPLSLRYLAKRIAGPGDIGDNRTEADVFTRWDTPAAVRRLLPPDLELVGFRGVRVFTPAAFVHRLPVVSRALSALEHVAVNSPLRYFGGFLIALLRRRG